ncbi:glycoside hydrolase family 13 protein, partial [Anaerosporobacter sp.]
DGTKQYRIPDEPMPNEEVKIRFRTARENVDQVFLITTYSRHEMKKADHDKLFDYYEGTIQLEEEKVEYYFEIRSGNYTCYYNRKGVMNEVQNNYNFVLMPGFKTPNWAKGAVFYQIFVDRFCNGDTSNDVLDREYNYIGEGTSEVNDWNKYPLAMGVREFYGGDLRGVMKKLDYLQSLGIDAIYLNPIFVSPSNHKYDIQDYDYVDPHFGVIVKDEGELLQPGDTNNQHATRYITRVTAKENLEASNALFIELVEEIHKRGMKIILDGVFNHCGSFNKWLDRECLYKEEAGYEKGAYIDENSPYHTFFKFRDGTWPYNNRYDGWWGHDTLPKLNYEESPKLYQYIMDIAKKWVSPPFNIDGWRLDVAADLGHSNEYNHKFWKDFRKTVKEANPNAIILAEHYGDPSSWLQGDEWDTVMNYDAFMEPLTWFLTGIEKHSDESREDLYGQYEAFYGSMSHHMTRFSTQSLFVAMNELSNHDHSRFLTRTNRRVGRTATSGPEAANYGINKAVMREAVLVQMTWPGAPTIYYGDEAGVCGWTDPDNRRTYPWGNEDTELISLHKELIRIHKNYDALKTGSMIFLCGGNHYFCFGRFDNTDKLVIIVNNSQEEKTIDVPVWQLGILDTDRLVSLIQTNREGHNLEAKMYPVQEGNAKVVMPPESSTIIKTIDTF